MAIENTYLTGNAIQLGSSGFDLAAPAPLDTRTTVPVYAGLAALKNGGAVYEGMRVYVEADDANGKRGNYQYINGEWKNELAELKTLIENTATAAMEFKGAVTALPENPSKGDFYKVTASFEVVEGETAQVGDSIVYDGEQWFLIPSGDDIEDTWRPITDVDNDATLTFAAGDKIDVAVASNGTVTYKHEAVVAPEDKGAKWVEVDSGYVGYPGKYKAVCSEEYMSTQAYDNLINNDYPHEADLYMGIDSYWPDGEGNLVGGSTSQLVEPFVDGVCEFELLDKQVYAYDEAGNPCEYSDYFLQFNPSSDGLKLYKQETTRTYITGVETDGFGHITGYTTATETVVDTNTTYEFEGQTDEATSVYLHVKASDAEQDEVIYLDAYSRNEVYTIEEVDDAITGAINDLSGAAAFNISQSEIDDWNNEVGAKELAQGVKDVVDANKATWDLARTAVQEEAFTEFKTANTKAIEDAQKAGEDAADAVDQKLTAYETAHKDDYTNDQIKEEINKATGTLGTMSTKDADDYLTKAQIESTYATDANAQKYADDALAEAKSYTNGLAGNYDKAGAAADVKSELEIEIAKKVDKVDGKDLIATSEIERLATLKNYDDTALAGRVTTAEGKITALEGASATKDELNAVDKKFEDYTKTADLPTDLGDFTNEAGYAKTADVSAELDKKADKTQVATDIANAIAPLATTEALNGVKATAEAATTVEEVDAQIDAKITALNLGTTYEPIGAEDRAKAYVDGKFTDANLAQYTTEDEVKSIVDGVIKTATSKETLDSLVELVEYIDTHSGDAINMATAIGVLEGKVETIEKKPAYEITATQISNWDNEVGAKALAETKTTTAEVKTQIEAYGYATTGYADGKADAAKDAAIADAATKYETIGTAQGIVDALKLTETYEPIGAETRAITAAKTETENQVKALAGEGNTSTVKKNAEDIANLFEMFQWGEF